MTFSIDNPEGLKQPSFGQYVKKKNQKHLPRARVNLLLLDLVVNIAK